MEVRNSARAASGAAIKYPLRGVESGTDWRKKEPRGRTHGDDITPGVQASTATIPSSTGGTREHYGASVVWYFIVIVLHCTHSFASSLDALPHPAHSARLPSSASSMSAGTLFQTR